MRIVEYAPEHFSLLAAAGEKAGNRSMQHRSFVDYYYASSPFCKMFVFCSDEGDAIGTIGIDYLDFRHGERKLRLSFSNNYHALESGVGGLLYVHWMRAAEMGIVFGGSDDTHKILRQQKWSYFSGIHELYLNWPYERRPDDPAWRHGMKAIARKLRHKPLSSYAARLPSFAREVTVKEEREFSTDMLPAASPFVFRFAPTLEYLSWRYSTALPFVRYRVFRILAGGATKGYVVLNDRPDRLIVAQTDADDTHMLAAGVLKALLAAASSDRKARTAMLTAAHRDLLRIYTEFGFQKAHHERPWALGTFRRTVDLDSDTSQWLINFDIGDNGLRYPFQDCAS